MAVSGESGGSLPGAWLPRGMARLAFAALGRSSELAAEWAPERAGGVALRELANKLRAFSLFQAGAGVRGRDGSALLADRVARVRRSEGPNRATWITEGLGYHHARHRLRRGAAAADLLPGALPPESLLPLHTGAGLALGERQLAELSPRSPGARIRAAVRTFLDLCREAARPGYEGAMVEALGLVARSLHPALLPVLDRELRDSDPDGGDLLWHGVGRALCFSPTRSLPWPGNTASALDLARTEPPDEAARRNAVAGFVWAVTLVNLRDPQVLEDLLRRRRNILEPGAAFANGVSSALVIWRDASPEDPAAASFCGHRSGADAAELWRRWVALGGCREVERRHAEVQAGPGIGSLFRCPPAPTGGSEERQSASGPAGAVEAAGQGLDALASRMIHTLVSPEGAGDAAHTETEEAEMPDTDLSDAKLKLARYTLLTVKPGAEEILDRGSLLLRGRSDPSGLHARIVRGYLQEHDLPAGDEDFLRVYFDVLSRYTVQAGERPAPKKPVASTPTTGKAAANKQAAKKQAAKKPAPRKAAATKTEGAGASREAAPRKARQRKRKPAAAKAVADQAPGPKPARRRRRGSVALALDEAGFPAPPGAGEETTGRKGAGRSGDTGAGKP